VEGLNHLESLQKLWIHDCCSLESLTDTSNLHLECSTIEHCEGLPNRNSYCRCHDNGDSVFTDPAHARYFWAGYTEPDLMKVRWVWCERPYIVSVRKSDQVFIVGLIVFLLFLFSFSFSLWSWIRMVWRSFSHDNIGNKYDPLRSKANLKMRWCREKYVEKIGPMTSTKNDQNSVTFIPILFLLS